MMKKMNKEDTDAQHDDNAYPIVHEAVRVFRKPEINFQALHYHDMTPMNQWYTVPPLITDMNDEQLMQMLTEPFHTKHQCHSQNVERHIKLVTEAAAAVASYERRDGVIRNRIRSQKLMKCFTSKKDFKT